MKNCSIWVKIFVVKLKTNRNLYLNFVLFDDRFIIMIVYKFGGASVKSALAVKKLADIVKAANNNLVVVISAMDKITNALEGLVKAYFEQQPDCSEKLNKIVQFHIGICEELFDTKKNESIFKKINDLADQLSNALKEKVTLNYDYEYDKIIVFGELFSTIIISEYLTSINVVNEWIDIRKILRTNSNFRDATVNFPLSEKLIKQKCVFKSRLDSQGFIYLTQGFISSDKNNINTTLGREGSDYTAALLAYFLGAERVVVWKDVPGIMDADPFWLSKVEKLDELSYQETIELAYYGAKVIHPKTIKPLQNKNIPLFVRSFINPDKKGTLISNSQLFDLKPVYIQKKDQVLLSILSTDFSFIVEENLSRIFALFAKYNIKVNLIQNSAISLSVCFNNSNKLENLRYELQKEYKVLYNKNVELITIRHYTENSIERVIGSKKILLEQKSRNTAQFVFQHNRQG